MDGELSSSRAHSDMHVAGRHVVVGAQVAIPVLSPQARMDGRSRGAPVTSHHGGMAPSHPSLRAAPAHALPRRRRYPWPEPSAHLICSALLPINARDRVALPLNGLGRCSRCVFSASALLPSPFQLPRSRTNSQGNGVGLPMLASCKHAVNRSCKHAVNRYLKVVGAALSSLPEPLHLLPVTFSCKCLKLLIL